MVRESALTRRTFVKGAGVAGVVALAGMTGMLSGCGKSSAPAGQGAGDKPDSLVIYVGAEPESGFDPLTGWGYNGAYLLFQSRLLSFGKNLELKPDLADSYEVSEDGLTYTYALREGAKFSDGSDLTADDVVFSFLEARDNGASTIDLTRLAAAEALDARTVVFTLKERDSSFVDKTGKLGIVKSEAYDPQSYRTNPIGSGPFRLVQWDKGQQIIIEPNEFYYGTISPFKQITLMFLDEEAALSNAQSGHMDVVMVNPEYATTDVEGMTLQAFETIDTRGFNLPCAPASVVDGKTVGNDVTSDPAIRKALAIGIDRQAIVDNALNGIGTPSTALITHVAWTNEACQFEDGRVEEAKQILEEAGWVEGPDGVREKQGLRSQFAITGRADDLQRYNIATALSQEAEKLGIKIDATSELWSQCKADAESIPTCWGTGDYDPSGDIAGYYATGSRQNRSQYSNPVVDGHIEAAFAAPDRDSAIEEWKKAQWDGATGPEGEDGDLPCLWLVSIDHTYFVRDGLDVGEQLVHPHGHGWPIVANLEEWTWK